MTTLNGEDPADPSVHEPDGCCSMCGGRGLVRTMTSHLGPDDYEYDDECPECVGSGSSDLKTAIESLPYSLHRVRGCLVIEREAVLRLVAAHLARAKTANAQVTGAGTASG